ncbi:MAG: cytochrome c6 [Gammaproteobacteria bacterium HGW-Gammaproteobacteria-10]|nr:MAG: cytochrome c6 [Gammaproteobacteria bacterium HGW-Gammaproteobacteria-10]
MSKSLKIALFSALSLTAVGVAQANDVFNKNCASCHAGGKNVMNPDKTLTSESLEKNGVNSLDAIKKLVSEGKAPMPGFASTLSKEEIESVSAYVLEQAKKGW